MLKILRYIFSVVTILFAAYGLVSKNYQFNYIMMFLLGLTMLILGLEEFRKEKKMNGWLFVIVFLFSLFVSIKGFLLS
ncbi:YczI family protein [Neobacillus mesonae]|uniref:YczI family protein n=1 Tax=Neobacillus mesonae TaxID=1193713 RepID=UPI00203ACAEB|nr:YczI family protein [Neobacillus mesonae]MCM3570265.1 YczI family protein [Neobacillus mesonae]